MLPILEANDKLTIHYTREAQAQLSHDICALLCELKPRRETSCHLTLDKTANGIPDQLPSLNHILMS
jgi:hypothetical protein